MKFTSFILFLIFIETSTSSLFAQRDTVFLKNKDVIEGKVTSMEKAILNMSTDYSNEDFTIVWSEIERISTHSKYLIMLSNGKNVVSRLKTIGNDSLLLVYKKKEYICNFDQVVYIKGVEDDFQSRLDASIDLGFSMAKANHLVQIDTRSNVKYSGDRWTFMANYNLTSSKQDSIPTTKMIEGNIGMQYLLEQYWFLSLSNTLLSNTEQAIKLRANTRIGAGRYIVRNNKFYWGVATGLAYMHEQFSNEVATRNSYENFLGSELNLFKINSMSLLTNIIVYRSLTESNRWRTDFSLDVKFDLPFNFYLQNGLTVNYDNQPAIEGNDVDYNLMVTVGWSF